MNEPRVSRWKSPNVWGAPLAFEGNPVSQLLVPTSEFTTVTGTQGALSIENAFGSWPAIPAGQVASAALHVQLPIGITAASPLTRASWVGDLTQHPRSDVLMSYRGALDFNEDAPEQPGLRTPQLGAVHAVLGHWPTGRQQAVTVVMPTGTGKTETMLALLVAARPDCLLVLVPSDQLRKQVAAKFERLGLLQELGIVASHAVRPVVGRVLHGFKSVENAAKFASHCNVIVATPSSLQASSADALDALLASCSHLFVDEAHHVAAPSWSTIREAFLEKKVVQFTATPFREDGKHLSGKTVYAFPLREAQRLGYFSTINYTAVVDFDDTDAALAEQAVTQLRADLSAGFDHVLMARVNGIPRAHEVKTHYDSIASDLKPVIINSGMSRSSQKLALAQLDDRSSRVIICVSMLGEGFDLPALKVAAVHDPQKSLGVTLQFIGRFARTSVNASFGEASVFVARKQIAIDQRLRSLYAEDADWNVILRDLTENSVQEQQDLSDFEAGFTSLPADITLRSLLPKMSSVVYRTATDRWEPQKLVDFFGESSLFTIPIGLNEQAGVAWCIVESHENVRWGDLRTIEEITYQLYVLYFDSARRLLYINNSANSGVFEELAEAVAGPGTKRFTGSTVYRAMADIQRLVPTTVGVLDARSQFRRFSMHVGSDVTASFSQAEAGTKSQTNISGGGYRNGERVSISASLKGRIWSYSIANSLKQWCDWCNGIGTLLLDDSISIATIIGQFILPEELTDRPDSILLAAEWPWNVHLVAADYLTLVYDEITYPLTYVDLVTDDFSTTGPYRFKIVTEAWSVGYQATVVGGKMVYSCEGALEVLVKSSRTERILSDWLNEQGLLLILDRDRIIEGNLLFPAVTPGRAAYDAGNLTVVDWMGTDIRQESQRAAHREESIQFRVIKEMILAAVGWEVILDDDGSGEVADIVALRTSDSELIVRLVHCKFSHGDTPGARLEDLYEVCGQAQRCVIWRKNDMEPFFKTLEERARRKNLRTGVSPFEVGDMSTLYKLHDRSNVLTRRMEVVIVQPGLSAKAATVGQLELLASTESYLVSTVSAPLEVWCSA